MGLFQLIASLLTLSAIFSYVNIRWLKFPTTIGLMAIALVFSVSLIALGYWVPGIELQAERIIGSIDFNKTLMHGMLGFLLFAGALHINLNDLAEQKWVIALLASVGVILSTIAMGLLAWGVFQLVGLEVRLIYCLMFGALISPTDPIAVLSILKKAGAPKQLEMKIAGESLFNDGVGVVLFLGLWEIATGHYGFDLPHLTALFFQEAVGGAIFGWALGYSAYRLLKPIDHYSVEILITLAVAAGGYALAGALHLSGPIAMVVAGLLIGNQGRSFAMSPETCEHLDTFWELVDEILNAVLFVLIGLELIILTFTGKYLLAGLLLIPMSLVSRFFSVALPIGLLRRWRPLHPKAIPVLTWGGLRGGVSVALTLSIPTEALDGEAIPERDPILAVTYMIVVFSVLVQGLTIGPFVKRLVPPETAPVNLESPS